MNRAAFMQQLESLLQNISCAERQEALQYYNDYFDDAGVENEEEVLENLGSPASIAENIINDLNGTDTSGWQQNKANPRAVVQYGETDASGFRGTGYQQGIQNTYTESKQGLSGGMIALIVVLAVLSCPIWIGLAVGLFGLLIGLFAGWFGIIIGFGGAALGTLVAALALVVVSIMCIPVSTLAGLAVFGIALILAALCLLFLMLVAAMAGIATPAIFKGIAWVCRRLFSKKA